MSAKRNSVLSRARRLAGALRFGVSARPAAPELARLKARREPSGLLPALTGDAMKAFILASVEGQRASAETLTRFAMYQALTNSLAAHDGLARKCLALSQSGRLARTLGIRAAEVIEASYPEHSMLALGYADWSFDFCVSDQVLEHVEGNPFDAVRESFRVVRPGGYVVHTTCFLNPVHGAPGDYWRFTPDALALMARAAGGNVVTTGSWGNREALALIQAGLRATKVPLNPEHPLHQIASRNDPKWPIHTWIVARKPVSA